MTDVENKEWQGFLYISRYAGMREDIVQAGGGNSSAKISGKRMYIKASGYSMADISERKGFSIIDQEKILRFLNSDSEISEEGTKKAVEEAFLEGEKPSIESFLHAMTGKYTLHSHPVTVNIMTSRENGEKELKELFPEALFVEYATPGSGLAKLYYERCMQASDKKIELVFLRNHGLIVSAESPGRVIERTEYVLKRLEEYLNLNMEGYRNATLLYEALPDCWEKGTRLVFPAFHEALAGLLLRNGGKPWRNDFCPDCIVYCGSQICVLEKGKEEEGLIRFENEQGDPSVILSDGHFYVMAQNNSKAWEIQSVLAFGGMVAESNQEEKMRYLPEEEKRFLMNWDAEKFRKNKG